MRTTRNVLQLVIDTSLFKPQAELRFQVGFLASKKCSKRDLEIAMILFFETWLQSFGRN